MLTNRLLVLCVLIALLAVSGCGSGDDTTDVDVTGGDETDGDVTDGDIPDGDIADGDATDGDDPIDGDIEAVDPATDCELPRDLLIGSCMIGTASCYEYYHEATAGSLSSGCVSAYHGTWSDGPCSPLDGLVLTGICRLQSESLGQLYESRWSYTPEFIPSYVAQLHNTMATSCQNLSNDSEAWCSIEDGSNVELDCSRSLAPGICDMQPTMPQCIEYGNATTAETSCASIDNGFQADANCPSEGLVGWCNNIGTSMDIFYYDAAGATEAVIVSCNGSGGWCTP